MLLYVMCIVYVSVIAFLYLHMCVYLFVWEGKWVGMNEYCVLNTSVMCLIGCICIEIILIAYIFI